MGVTIGLFHEDIAIDSNDLEGEWLTHASKVMLYSELYADCLFYRDELKRKLEYIDATLYLDIRSNPKKYGFDAKPSEPAIKARVTVHPKHYKADKKLGLANKDLNMLIEIKRSFEHRKASLSGVVSLRITGFHSEPRNNIADLRRQKDYVQDKGHKEKLNKSRRLKKRKKKKAKE